MIKSLIILVLVIIVLGGLALSRPSEESFKAYYRQRVAKQDPGLLDKIFHESRVNEYLGQTTYTNRILWADVEHQGKTVYTGAFSKWFPRGQAATPQPSN